MGPQPLTSVFEGPWAMCWAHGPLIWGALAPLYRGAVALSCLGVTLFSLWLFVNLSGHTEVLHTFVEDRYRRCGTAVPRVRTASSTGVHLHRALNRPNRATTEDNRATTYPCKGPMGPRTHGSMGPCVYPWALGSWAPRPHRPPGPGPRAGTGSGRGPAGKDQAGTGLGPGPRQQARPLQCLEGASIVECGLII